MKILFRYLIFVGIPYFIAKRIEKYFWETKALVISSLHFLEYLQFFSITAIESLLYFCKLAFAFDMNLNVYVGNPGFKFTR